MQATLIERRRVTNRKRKDKAIKIDEDLAMKAKIIANGRGLSIAEYVSSLIRPIIAKDWPKALKRLQDGPEKEAQS